MQCQQFLQDGNGRFSATRLAFLLWTVGVLAVWIYLSINHPNTDIRIDSSVTVLIGVLMTGKVVQSFSRGDQGAHSSGNAAPMAVGEQSAAAAAGLAPRPGV